MPVRRLPRPTWPEAPASVGDRWAGGLVVGGGALFRYTAEGRSRKLCR